MQQHLMLLANGIVTIMITPLLPFMNLVGHLVEQSQCLVTMEQMLLVTLLNQQRALRQIQ